MKKSKDLIEAVKKLDIIS